MFGFDIFLNKHEIFFDCLAEGLRPLQNGRMSNNQGNDKF